MEFIARWFVENADKVASTRNLHPCSRIPEVIAAISDSTFRSESTDSDRIITNPLVVRFPRRLQLSTDTGMLASNREL